MRSSAGAAIVGGLALVLAAAALPARAEPVPPLVEIPADVASAHPELASQKAALVGERNSLRSQTKAHAAECGSVVAGTAADRKCAQDNTRLSADVAAHIAASKRFNAAVAAAERRAAVCAAVRQAMVVDLRAAHLAKAIELLSDPERFEVDRERVLEDLGESAKGFSFEAVNLVTLGLARGAKEFARFNILAQKANAAKFASQLGQIANEEARMDRVISELKDTELVRRVFEYKSALNKVRIAEEGAKSAEMVSHTREAGEALLGNYELMKIKPPARSVSNALYGSSAALGSVAIIFVEGPGAVAATAGSAAASVAIGGREAVDMWDELGRLKEVYLDRRKREQMKDELVTRLGKVRQRQAELAMAAKGAACGG
ncbi:MAG TPA: hypothetical protein VFB13_04090 [Reyranella sp.]|jgi:hypothetical protein|nr:hypothetical protein [Reyranella sp.]